MSSTKIGIAYSKTTGRVRWFVIPDNDKELDSLKAGEGEIILIVNRSVDNSLPILQAQVTQSSGLTPSNDRYAIIDPNQTDAQGNQIVIGAVIADPSCGDKFPGKTFISHAQAGVGWSYDPAGKIFVAPVISQVIVSSDVATGP